MEMVLKVYKTVTWGNTLETEEDWYNILTCGSEVEKLRLFEKIFKEDASGDGVKSLFNREEVLFFLNKLNKSYHRKDQERRRLVWRYAYLDIPAVVPGLNWVVTPRGEI